jgi:hypothetical protein
LVYSFDGEATTGDGAELPFLAQLSGLEVRALQRAAGATKRGTEKGDRPHFLQRCPKVSGETWSVPVFRFLLVFFSSGNSTLVCSHCRLWTCPEAHPMDRARLQAESASGSTAGPITTPFFSASFARYIRASVDCRPFLKGGLGEWATSAPTGCPPTHHTPLPITGLSESPADENGAVVIGAGA